MAPLKNGSSQPMGVRVGELITFAACWHAATTIWHRFGQACSDALLVVLACMRFPVWLGARCRKTLAQARITSAVHRFVGGRR